MATIVTNVGSSIFDILLPIKIVVMNSSGSDNKRKSCLDFLSSSFSAFVWTLILLTAVKAVSLPEKKKDVINKAMIAIITECSSSDGLEKMTMILYSYSQMYS